MSTSPPAIAAAGLIASIRTASLISRHPSDLKNPRRFHEDCSQDSRLFSLRDSYCLYSAPRPASRFVAPVHSSPCATVVRSSSRFTIRAGRHARCARGAGDTHASPSSRRINPQTSYFQCAAHDTTHARAMSIHYSSQPSSQGFPAVVSQRRCGTRGGRKSSAGRSSGGGGESLAARCFVLADAPRML